MLINILCYDVFIQSVQNIFVKNDGGKVSLQEAAEGHQGSEASDSKAGPIKGEHMDTPFAQDLSTESK